MRTTPALLLVLLAGFLLLGVGTLTAQDAERDRSLTGRVVDARTEAPIRGAFVGLAPAEEGVFTDSLGNFDLPVFEAESYTLVAEQLGYADARVSVSSGGANRPVEIRIEPDPVALEGLEVVTSRFTRERHSYAGAVTHYDQDYMFSQPGQTAFDVVYRTAQLRPCGGTGDDEWCTVSRGRVVPVRVYVDEIPVAFDGVNWLRDYDAREIYLMEVYGFGRVIRVLTRWAVEERPEQLAAMRTLPIVPAPWEMGRRGGLSDLTTLDASDPRQLRIF